MERAEWTEEFWRRSDVRYRVRENDPAHEPETLPESMERESAETFLAEGGELKNSVRLASLENSYGQMEFSGMENRKLMVSFRKKREFEEPGFSREMEKVNLGHAVKDGEGNRTVVENNLLREKGAQALVFPTGFSGERSRKLLEAYVSSMEDSMAAALFPQEAGPVPENLRYEVKTAVERVMRRASSKIQDMEPDQEREDGFSWRLRRKQAARPEDGADGPDGPDGGVDGLEAGAEGLAGGADGFLDGADGLPEADGEK